MTTQTEAHRQRLSAAMFDAAAILDAVDDAPYTPFEMRWIKHVAAELRALIAEVEL